MILQRLKRDTADHHAQIERRIELETLLSSREAYRAGLARFYGFYAPLESALAGVAGLEQALRDLGARWKTELLARDLAALDLSPEARRSLPRCAELPALPDVAHALGAIYVLEGATLGGQIITRQVAERLGVRPDCGGAFFVSYGPQTGPMWRGFGAALASYATTPEREEALVGAARATFGAFDRWLADKRS